MINFNLHQKGGMKFPPSVQSDLYKYLTEEQKQLVTPVFRKLKKKYQQTLCILLLDYLKRGMADIPKDDTIISALFAYITRTGKPNLDNLKTKSIIRPLSLGTTTQLSTIIK